MFATTSRPTAIPQPHAAPAGPAAEAGAVRRIRVTRRSLVRTHRARRGVLLPAVRRADSYLVRVARPEGARPEGALPPAVLRIPVMAPHRERVAR